MTQAGSTVFVVGHDLVTEQGFIRRLDAATGEPIEPVWDFKYGDFTSLADVAVDDAHNLHVTGVSGTKDAWAIAVASLSPAGDLIFLDTVDPAISGEKAGARDIEVRGDLVVVAHSAEGQVGLRASTTDGSNLWHITRPGVDTFFSESTLDANGDAYLTWQVDAKTSRLCKFDVVP